MDSDYDLLASVDPVTLERRNVNIGRSSPLVNYETEPRRRESILWRRTSQVSFLPGMLPKAKSQSSFNLVTTKRFNSYERDIAEASAAVGKSVLIKSPNTDGSINKKNYVARQLSTPSTMSRHSDSDSSMIFTMQRSKATMHRIYSNILKDLRSRAQPVCSSDRFRAFSAGLECVIDHSNVSAFLLSRINQGYKSYVASYTVNDAEIFYIRGSIQRFRSEELNLNVLKHRVSYIERQSELYRKENEVLKKQLLESMQARHAPDATTSYKVDVDNDVTLTSTCSRHIRSLLSVKRELYNSIAMAHLKKPLQVTESKEPRKQENEDEIRNISVGEDQYVSEILVGMQTDHSWLVNKLAYYKDLLNQTLVNEHQRFISRAEKEALQKSVSHAETKLEELLLEVEKIRERTEALKQEIIEGISKYLPSEDNKKDK